MKSFNDTKDGVEILFKDSILKRFPNYARFWEKFYGYKNEFLPNLRPYGLRFPVNYNTKSRVRIENIYHEINIVYYHIFCSLSSAYYELENFKNSSSSHKLTKNFILIHSINSFYLNIGICRDMVNRLIKLILIDLANEDMKIPTKCKECGQGELGYLNSFNDYLHKKKYRFAKKFEGWKSRINKIRSRLSHYGSIGFIIDPNSGEEYMPDKLARDQTWKKDWEQIKTGNKRRVIDSINYDLKATEEILNLLFNIFIKKFQESLNKEKIKINY